MSVSVKNYQEWFLFRPIQLNMAPNSISGASLHLFLNLSSSLVIFKRKVIKRRLMLIVSFFPPMMTKQSGHVRTLSQNTRDDCMKTTFKTERKQTNKLKNKDTMSIEFQEHTTATDPQPKMPKQTIHIQQLAQRRKNAFVYSSRQFFLKHLCNTFN